MVGVTRINRVLALAGAAVLLSLGITAQASAFSPGKTVLGYEAAFGGAQIIQYDLNGGNQVAACTPPSTGNGRGLAKNESTGVIYYSFLNGFTGDGLIHKLSGFPSCADAGSIPAPSTSIGALDFQPGNQFLWASDYNPGGMTLYKLNPTTGAVLKTCVLPNGSYNDTLSVVRLSGLGGSGTYVLTDEADIGSNTLYAIDTANCNQAAAFTTSLSGVSGIDMVQNHLLGTDVFNNIYDMGTAPPFAGHTPVASNNGHALEDLSES